MENEESLNFGSGNLYSPHPIPAYDVLAAAKEYNAQRVLMSFINHMGYNNRCVWPSYQTIALKSGVRNTNTISASITTLVEYGFVKTYKYRDGRKNRVKYYLQGSCWNSALMNPLARRYIKANARCLACLRYLDRGEYGISGKTKVHYGCGGIVIKVVEREMPRKQIPWRDRIGREEDVAEEN
jgi:hypothetical protein